MDNDESPHGLVYDVSSVESDTEYSSTGYSTHADDDTEDGCSSVDEKDVQIAGANKKANCSLLDMKTISYHFNSVCVRIHNLMYIYMEKKFIILS